MKRLMILIAGDSDAGFQGVLVELLRAKGHATLSANSLKEAKDLITGNSELDVIIAEFTLSQYSGLDVLQFAKDKFPNIRGFLMSDLIGEGMRDSVQRLGFKAFEKRAITRVLHEEKLIDDLIV